MEKFEYDRFSCRSLESTFLSIKNDVQKSFIFPRRENESRDSFW